MIVHIFRKDVRRLWPYILATLVLLGALAWHDRWRSDWMPGSIEGWLNLLVPLAWACLIGLVVEQEPLVGDRQFWTTRPYRRGALLAAKLLFVAMFVHVPSLLADAYILAMRGFPPRAYLPHLLGKQVVLAAALTVPALALATLVRNFTHFILALVAVAAGMVFLSGAFGMQMGSWEPVDGARRGLAILIVVGVSLIVTFLQFISRKLALARAFCLAGGVAAGALFTYLLPQSAYAVRSALEPAHTEIGLRVMPHGAPDARWSYSERMVVAVPVDATGVPNGEHYSFDPLRTELTLPGGERYRARTRDSYKTTEKFTFDAQLGSMIYGEPGPTWLILSINRGVYDARLRGHKVSVSGDLGVTLFRLGPDIWMPAEGEQSAASVGRCNAALAETRIYSENQLKVECESPVYLTMRTRVRLWHQKTGREWKSGLGGYGTFLPGPRLMWLSPLQRRQTTFNLAEGEPRYGELYKVPAGYVPEAKLALTPEVVTGYAVVRYEFRDLSLDGYIVPPRATP